MPNLKRNGETVEIVCNGCGKTVNVPAYYDYAPKFCSVLCSNKTHNKKVLPDYCIIDGCGKRNYIAGLCQMHHWRKKNYGDPMRERPVMLCLVDGCNRKRKIHGFCQLHFRRQRDGIPMNFVAPVLSSKHYKTMTIQSHPLSDARGRVAEHRMVLFESIGYLRAPCFWCGTGVIFGENLVVDHLNHDRHDNRIENLVPSCIHCNSGRTIRNPNTRESVYSVGSLVV